MDTESLEYTILKRNPVARFFYRGHHSHPVRRTVLIISTKGNRVVGYELREGETVRDLADAPVKAYCKSRIPRWGDYWRLRRYGRDAGESTFRRSSLRSLDRVGA